MCQFPNIKRVGGDNATHHSNEVLPFFYKAHCIKQGRIISTSQNLVTWLESNAIVAKMLMTSQLIILWDINNVILLTYITNGPWVFPQLFFPFVHVAMRGYW